MSLPPVSSGDERRDNMREAPSSRDADIGMLLLYYSLWICQEGLSLPLGGHGLFDFGHYLVHFFTLPAARNFTGFAFRMNEATWHHTHRQVTEAVAGALPAVQEDWANRHLGQENKPQVLFCLVIFFCTHTFLFPDA